MHVRDCEWILAGRTRVMRQVLLKYLDHNKIVKIPDDKQGTDIAYLTNQFRKLFAYENHVVVNVTFQRFHPDWGVFLDVDESDQSVNDREQLKVIVTPVLTTPAASEISPKIGTEV